MYRRAAALTLVLSGGGAAYALWRMAAELCQRLPANKSLQPSQLIVMANGWRLAKYAAVALLLAAWTGWLWRKMAVRVPLLRRKQCLPAIRPAPLLSKQWHTVSRLAAPWHVAAALTIAAWGFVALKACRKWFALAHESLACDALLIALPLVFLTVVLLGARLGTGRRFAAIRARWWLALVAAAWLVVVFYANQLAPLLSVAATLAVAAVLGWLFLQRVGLAEPLGTVPIFASAKMGLSPLTLDALLLSVGLGLGALGLATLALGQLHLLYWWLVAPAYGCVFYAGYRRFGPQWRCATASTEAVPSGGPASTVSVEAVAHGTPVEAVAHGAPAEAAARGLFWVWLALALALVLTVCLVGNLGPEVWCDAIMGRLGAPAMYVRDHAVEPKPNIFYTYSTCGSEMLFTLAILLGGQVGAGRLMHFALGLLSLAAVFALGRRWLDGRVGLLAAFTVGSSSVVWWLLTSGYTDLAFLFFGLLAGYALYRWLETDAGAWLAVSGLMAGFAAGVKLTGGLLIGAALLVVGCVSLLRARSLRNAAVYRTLVGYCLCCAVGVVPWLVRTYWYTGNPVWPSLLTTFDPSWPADMVPGRHYRPGDSLADYLSIPCTAVFARYQLIEGGAYSPFWLALLPGVAGLGMVRPPQRWFVLYACAATALWVATDVNLRYGLAPMALLSVVAAGMVVEGWRRCRPALRCANQLLLATAAAASLCYVLLSDSLLEGQDGAVFPYMCLFGAVSPEAQAEKIAPELSVSHYLNRTYGERAKVWSPVYLDVLTQKCEGLAWVCYGRQRELAALVDPAAATDDIYDGLQRLGITHLVCRDDYLRDDRGNGWMRGAFSSKFVDDPQYCELEFAAQGHYLFRVRPRQEAARPRQIGPNLLHRADFAGEYATASDEAVAHVDADHRLEQTVRVQEGSLYRLSVSARPEADEAGLMAIVWWLDGRGVPAAAPLLTPVRLAGGFETIVRYETAPLGAREATVEIYSADRQRGVRTGRISFARVDTIASAPRGDEVCREAADD